MDEWAGGVVVTGDQFRPIDSPYLNQWRDRLTDPKPAKVKPKPRKKGKRKAKK